MSKVERRLLLIEDNAGDVRLLRKMLNEESSRHTRVKHVGCIQDAEHWLSENEVDIILLDLGLPDAQGQEALQRVHSVAPHVPLVVLTGMDDEGMALQSLHGGAQDYLVKGQIETRDLLRALRYAMERKSMEEALHAEKEVAQVTLNCIGDAVVCADIDGRITFLNFVAESMTGWSLPQLAGKPMGEVFRISGIRDSEVSPDLLNFVAAHLPASPLSPDSVLICRDGSEIPVAESVAPIHDHDGATTGVVIVLRDIRPSKAMALQITHSAKHDFLTGLPNRMLLHDRITQAIAVAQLHRRRVAVLYLDLDGFKHINDSLGHTVGDKLLQSIAGRLTDCVSSTDTVSRQGGDEFVVLLSEMQQSNAATVMATCMLRTVGQAHSIAGHDLHVTTSIGVSVYPQDGADAEELIKNADTAMYQAKESGRHRFQFFRSSMNARAVERQFIEESLGRALERHEFTVHYQPKVNLKTGEITGAEALLRWTHPTRGMMSPAIFIPVAEDCGLIVPIGNWVLRHACEQARAWRDAGLPTMIMAVNVSGREFRDPHFLQGLFDILRDTEVAPNRLELELTESVLMKRVEATAEILQTLRSVGVQVAVDDFGTGYSSLSYLRKLPIDALKIDQSFVRRIQTNSDDATIVTAVINMGRSLKLRVVAEGVETREELTFLQAQHCEEAQGYFFSRPVPAQQFAKLLVDGIPQPASRLLQVRETP